MTKTTVSVITVCFNCLEDLEKTLNNLISINYSDMEIIVIDGGSTDGTAELIEKHKHNISYSISEPDNGIYDAMNKGLSKATGNWIIFMNAGDIFSSVDTLKEIDFTRYENSSILYGNTIRDFTVRYPNKLKAIEYGYTIGCHQSMIFNRDILAEELIYNSELILNGDSELVARIYLKNHTITYIDQTIAEVKGNGLSSIFSFKSKIQKYSRMLRLFGPLGVLRTMSISLRIMDKKHLKIRH